MTMSRKGTTRDNETLSSELSRIIPAKKINGVSGDDELPERDGLGERKTMKRQRDLKLVKDNVEVIDGSEDDFYLLVKRQRELKLKMREEKYGRNLQDVSEADAIVDGKRYISAQMEKNKGLTRNRKKQNPRVMQRKKFAKVKKRRQGQVPEMRQQSGPYEWEKTGINPCVTKSRKFG